MVVLGDWRVGCLGVFVMAGERAGSIAKSRGQFWAWWVSLLLLLATMLNYMDRQALSVMSKRITGELEISNEQYGDLEFGFGVAFAAGSLRRRHTSRRRCMHALVFFVVRAMRCCASSPC